MPGAEGSRVAMQSAIHAFDARDGDPASFAMLARLMRWQASSGVKFINCDHENQGGTAGGSRHPAVVLADAVH